MSNNVSILTTTSDQRIDSYTSVISPSVLQQELPANEQIVHLIRRNREAISTVINAKDDRLLVIVGPCSIHDERAAIDYAQKLKQLAEELENDLLIIMRVYFEKPRTTVGWKGLINDPNMDNSFDINRGLRKARDLMLQINAMGLGVASEFLDLLSPQYIADLVSWGAIGARTTESQGHRELASGVSCPVGFKNGTSGSTNIACDAILASKRSHIFMGIDQQGQCSIVKTKGNADCHVILRGGKKPNFDAVSVNKACEELQQKSLPERVMIDFSHANSLKQHKRQLLVADDVSDQISNGDKRIIGVMIESFLHEGNQGMKDLNKLNYGVSVTDACINWEDTVEVLRNKLAIAVSQRRNINSHSPLIR